MNMHAIMAAYHVQLLNTQNHTTLIIARREFSRLNRLSRATLFAWSNFRRRVPIMPYCVESIPMPAHIFMSVSVRMKEHTSL